MKILVEYDIEEDKEHERENNYEEWKWIGKFVGSPRDTLEYETKGHIPLYIYLYNRLINYGMHVYLSFMFFLSIVCSNSGIRGS